MKKLFGLLLLLLLPLSFIHATPVFSNPDDSSLFPDTWANGTSETIAWTASISPAKLVLFRNTTGTNVFVKNIITLPAGAKSYPWIVNVATPGPGYKIAICPTTAWLLNYNSACQFSNSFTVTGPVTETPTTSITPTLTVSPTTIQPGGSATLNWKCDPVAKCYCSGSLIGGTGQLMLSELGLGSKSVSPTQTTTYTLSCRDKTITNSSYISTSAVLTVSSEPTTPSVKIILKANDVDQDITIKAGTTVNLSWQKVGTGVGFTSCRLGSQPADTSWDGVGGNVSGSKPVTPTVTTSYSIICWDSAETNYTDNLKVTVENPVIEIPPPVIVSTSKDTDKDGILDKDDKCPNTTSGAKVEANGCPKRFSGFVCNRNNPDRPVCKLNFGSGTTQTSCRADCKPVSKCSETSFFSIANKLDSNQYTLITEKNFKGWASQDPYDPSGDIQEIREKMGSEQRCYVVNNDRHSYEEKGSKALDILLTKSLPTPFTFFVLNPIDIDIVSNLVKYRAVGGHATVLTSISRTAFGYSLTIIDSNSDIDGNPKKMTVDCEYQKTKIFYPSQTGIPGQFIEETGDVICQYKYSQRDADGNLLEGWLAAYPMITPSNVTNGQDIAGTSALISARQAYCQSPDGRKNPNFCQRNVAKWLEDNYPLIPNQGVRGSEAGMCAGWSTFLLKVAYLGDFTGTDCYHEGEKSNSTSFQTGKTYLANSWQAISSPFNFLKDWFKNLK